MADRVTLVLLAAGASSRMRGADKLLEEVDGRPLLRVMAERCAKAGPVRVVLGPDQLARRATLKGLEVEIVEATESDGMAASIRAGVDGLNAEGAMIVLADMPEIMAADLHLLIGLWEQGVAPIVQAATSDGLAGAPVLFGKQFFKELSALQGDVGAKSVLNRHSGKVALIPLKGNRARLDLDTPEDWASWHAARRT